MKKYFNSIFIRIVFFTSFFSVVVFLNNAVFAQTGQKISFSKNVIAFIPWGDANDQVRLLKREQENRNHQVDLENPKTHYFWPRTLRIDGEDNVYMRNGNGQIFVFSENGAKKILNFGKEDRLSAVDQLGDIYSSFYSDDGGRGFVLTKQNGNREVYKNFDLLNEENGVAYSATPNVEPITIFDNQSNLEKMPPQLISNNREADFNQLDENAYVFKTDKINKHLEKIHRSINSDKVQIELEEKKSLGFLSNFLGMDDDKNFYFLCCYIPARLSEPWTDADVAVYSSVGEKIASIPVVLDFFDQQVTANESALDISGNVFQLSASKDGMYIYKWSKK